MANRCQAESPGGEQFGGVGVAQPVGGDRAAGIESAGCGPQRRAQGVVVDTARAGRQHQRSARARTSGAAQALDQCPGLLGDRDEALGVELAERHLQGVVAGGVFAHAVAVQRDELADAQPGPAHQQQAEGAVGAEVREPSLQLAIDIGRKTPEGTTQYNHPSVSLSERA